MASLRWWIGLFIAGLGSLLLGESAEAQFVFFPVSPCRIVDTRVPIQGPALLGGASRDFIATGVCGIPAGSSAVAFNFTVVNATSGGFLTVYPGFSPVPGAALLEFGPGQSSVVSNSAIVALNAGTLSTYVSNIGGTVDLIINVYGYFTLPLP
jgi:hypothetical protein